MLKIFKYSFQDLIRSKWSFILGLFYMAVTFGLLYMSNDLSRAIVSLMNIILFINPLVGIMLGIMYYYNSRDFSELLLAQPIKRKDYFLGQYLGLSLSLVISFVLGLGVPFLLYGVLVSDAVVNFLTLMFAGSALVLIFCALAFWVATANENKIKGFGKAILLWLFFAILYDGIFLLSLLVFESYPLEKFSIAATLLNPIDFSRVLIMLQLDVSLLFGYTGAVFNKFFGSYVGILLITGAAVIWVISPIFMMLRAAKRKDF